MASRVRIAKLILTGQFLVTLIICISTALAFPIEEQAAGCIIGLISVQILLSAVWVVMGLTSFALRFSSGAGITLFLVACFYRVAWRDGGGHGIALSIALPMLLLWVGVQIPLWVARAKGWKLGDPDTGHEAALRKEFQFGIRQILIWTAIVAILITTIKFLVGKIDTSIATAGPINVIFHFATFLTVGTALIAVPVAWGAFVNKHPWFWFLIAIVMCMIVSVAQVLLLSGAGDYTLLLLANLVQTALSVVAMFFVRLLGLRLVNTQPQI